MYSASGMPRTGGVGRGAEKCDLTRDVRLRDRHRERQSPAEVFRRPVEKLPALAQVQLVDLGAEAERPDPMYSGLDAEIDLTAHGAAIETSSFVEECVEDGINAANLLCVHHASPLRRYGTYSPARRDASW